VRLLKDMARDAFGSFNADIGVAAGEGAGIS
jgi:hypothetical protein